MRISDWSSDVCSSDLLAQDRTALQAIPQRRRHELVIDAPTDVVGERRAPVAPPGVVLAFRVQRAVGVDPPTHPRCRAFASAAVAYPAVEPGAPGRPAPEDRLAIGRGDEGERGWSYVSAYG